MTSPLYSVGQHVAVCTLGLTIVIPQTIVTDSQVFPHGIHRATGREYFGIRLYRVKGCDIWLWEHSLRPIQPGEYLTDSAPQKLETTL